MTNREERFFNIAREVSFLSDFYPHMGCIVVEGKIIIASGANHRKTHPLQKRLNLERHFENHEQASHRVHCEINALSSLIGKQIDWAHVSIYVYRELKNGKPACSRPCLACRKAITDLGIKNVYYINELGVYVKERILN